MRGVFDDEEVEPAKPMRDVELTLGSTMLLGILMGLVVICGLCFGLGYAVGHRGAHELTATTQPGAAPTALQADSSRSKPSAIAQIPVAPEPAQQTAGEKARADADPDTNPIANSQAPASPGGPNGSSLQQPQVRPALPAAANPGQPVEPGAGPGGVRTVQPALDQANLLMVQIAAVTYPEDAVVLVNALHKHGYAVYVRHEAADGLIHVRIGPFTSRDEADKWRLRLMNEGYNAIVQP
jgi:hypothetical protein